MLLDTWQKRIEKELPASPYSKLSSVSVSLELISLVVPRFSIRNWPYYLLAKQLRNTNNAANSARSDAINEARHCGQIGCDLLRMLPFGSGLYQHVIFPPARAFVQNARSRRPQNCWLPQWLYPSFGHTYCINVALVCKQSDSVH